MNRRIDEAVAARAYELWEQAGKPEGREKTLALGRAGIAQRGSKLTSTHTGYALGEELPVIPALAGYHLPCATLRKFGGRSFEDTWENRSSAGNVSALTVRRRIVCHPHREAKGFGTLSVQIF